MTIVEAILIVMRDAGRPMSALEVCDAIGARQLYVFKAKQPASIVHQQIRRHCVGVDNAASSKTRYFARSGAQRYVVVAKQA